MTHYDKLIFFSFSFFLSSEVGNTNTDFAIDSSSGVITVNKALDVTTTPTYTLTVTVTDGGTTARSVTTTVTVTVTDVNNNSPTCTLSTVYVNIVEPAAVSDAVSMSQWLDHDTTLLPGTHPLAWPVTLSMASYSVHGQ